MDAEYVVIMSVMDVVKFYMDSETFTGCCCIPGKLYKSDNASHDACGLAVDEVTCTEVNGIYTSKPNTGNLVFPGPCMLDEAAHDTVY